jgi:hypothetical protein
VQQQCIGKPSCSIKLSGLKCEADLQETKQSLPLYLSAQCNVQPQLSLDATIPVSSAGLVTIWNLGQANLVVKESNKIVWSNNKFVASASEGVESAVAGPDGVIFKVKPGSYSFVTSNANATTIQSATLASVRPQESSSLHMSTKSNCSFRNREWYLSVATTITRLELFKMLAYNAEAKLPLRVFMPWTK